MVHLGFSVTLICAFAALHQVAGFPKYNDAKINPYEADSKQYRMKGKQTEWHSKYAENEVLKPDSYLAENDFASHVYEVARPSKSISASHTKPHSPDRTYGPHCVLPKSNKGKLGTIQSKSKCNCDCSLDDPVCGRSQNGNLEDFPSRCAMKCHACCYGTQYTIYCPGACPGQGTTTPLHQVAGFPKLKDDPLPTKINPYKVDGKQNAPNYGYQCALPKSNVGIQGSSQPKRKCNCECPLDKPVCGRAQNGNLEDFPSKCSMGCYACCEAKRYTLYRIGACPPVQSPTDPPPRPPPTPKPPCKCQCPMGAALCSRDKYGNTQTFGSECLLNCYNCTHNEDYRKIKDGDC